MLQIFQLHNTDYQLNKYFMVKSTISQRRIALKGPKIQGFGVLKLYLNT